MNTETDKERLEKLLEYLKLSRNALGIAIGESNGSKFNHIINGRNGISEKLAKKITEKFPEINYNWLFSGKGEMILLSTFDKVNSKFIETISGEKIDIDIIVDALLINTEKFENNLRFKKYLEAKEDKAIIRYQEKLIIEYQKNKSK